MGTLRWYKRDPRAALAGMMELTLEERGAYNTILDLIYAHDGAIEDNSHLLAGWLHVDVRIWKRLRTRLLSLGKVYIHAGTLRNERADEEVHRALKRITDAAEAGLASAKVRGYGIRPISGMRPTAVQPSLELPTSTKKILSYAEAKGLQK